MLATGCANRHGTEDFAINIALCGEMPEGFNEIAAEWEQELADLGIGVNKLNFEFISDTDEDNGYTDTMYVRLLAGRDYDLVYDSANRNFNYFKDSGIYLALYDYLEGGYPSIRGMYTENAWNSQKDEYGDIYGIPCKNTDTGFLCLPAKSHKTEQTLAVLDFIISQNGADTFAFLP